MALISRIFITGSLAFSCAFAQAEIVTFDDTSYGPLGVYDGLDWLSAYDTPGVNSFNFGALGNAVVSGPAIAYWTGFNSNDPLIISTIVQGQSFTFNSGFFTAAANDGLQITVVGGTGTNTITHTANFVANTSGPTFQSFDWTGLNFVYMYGSGGTRNPSYASGPAFAIDNITLDAVAAVPEPSLWMLSVAAFSVFAVRHRKRQ